jgi:hypothetical protein
VSDQPGPVAEEPTPGEFDPADSGEPPPANPAGEAADLCAPDEEGERWNAARTFAVVFGWEDTCAGQGPDGHHTPDRNAHRSLTPPRTLPRWTRAGQRGRGKCFPCEWPISVHLAVEGEYWNDVPRLFPGRAVGATRRHCLAGELHRGEGAQPVNFTEAKLSVRSD